MAPPVAADLRVNPFLHIDEDRIYNPLTDRALTPSDPEFAALHGFIGGGPASNALERAGWIVRDDVTRNYRLKIVSLELMTACNQKCYFCPVSIAPREDAVMSEELLGRIVDQLSDFRGTVEAVFLQSYNEPTLDRRFVEHCKTLFAADLPVAVLTNGTGLTPSRIDALVKSGPLRYISVNISTLDHQQYRHDRGEDHVDMVLRNLDYAKTRRLAEEMNIVVLGTGNEQHSRDFEAIRDRFAGSRFNVEQHIVMDRAGWLDIGLKPSEPKRELRGCDNVGSRPLQHLHITPKGKCVLCCEDYDERYVVGDLTTSTIDEVLRGDEVARLRRWIYGLEEAPENFICRNCVYAR
jgi:hypothetical protein